MEENNFDVIIIGSGLSGLTAAARIIDERTDLKIAIVNAGNGASYFIDAINAVTPKNTFGDTIQIHAHDMFETGGYLNNNQLVQKICQEAYRCVEILENWGISFKKEGNQYSLHRTSGSSFARSLFTLSTPVGKSINFVLKEKLKERGVQFINNTLCTKLLLSEEKAIGITTQSSFSDDFRDFFAPVVVIAWGGIGNLYPNSTYPSDVNGSSIAIAFNEGLELLDLEFIEFEPLVILWPSELKGHICPTALLGDGGVLRNKNFERFLFKWRKEGESGAPKALINKAGSQEIANGKGTLHGGFYYDFRGVPLTALEQYKWFFEKLEKANINYQQELLEVGLAAHSHSGGIKVNKYFQTKVKGLYAVGEAVGGIHGACRLGGNSSTQALVSGILAAEKVLECENFKIFRDIKVKNFNNFQNIIDKDISQKIKLRVQSLLNKSLGFYRNKKDLETCKEELASILSSDYLLNDLLTKNIVLSALLIVNSALLREESRGNHNRLDFPYPRKDWQCSIKVWRSLDNEIMWEKIKR